jgi:hypothetical protein
MSRDKVDGKFENDLTHNNEGLKRRDLLLSGTSLVAASAFVTIARPTLHGFDEWHPA